MDELIQEYLRLAAEWGEVMESGDSRRSNKIHEAIQGVYCKIQSSGDEEALFQRTDDAEDSARFWIASHIKDCDKERAMNIYKELVVSDLPFVAVSSKYILKENGIDI